MLIRQSNIHTWQRCPLIYRFQEIDGLPREENSAAPFGSALHSAIFVLETTLDLHQAQEHFREQWSMADFAYFLPKTSFTSYMDKGLRILSDWWEIQQWNASKVLAREHYFEVPLGRHTLFGTIDRLELRYPPTGPAVCILDYKTNTKLPTRVYLRHDVQFTAYCYATTRPEFWESLGGQEKYETYKSWDRMGEWIALANQGGPKRVPAGERIERDYRRLEAVVDAMEDSISMGIFIPNLRGDVCEFCEYRKPCGLPATKEMEE